MVDVSILQQMQMEIVCRPSCHIQRDLQFIIDQLAMHRYPNANKLILDLEDFHELSTTILHLIVVLFQECSEQDFDFEIVHASDEVFKSLIHESLEFLEVVCRY